MKQIYNLITDWKSDDKYYCTTESFEFLQEALETYVDAIKDDQENGLFKTMEGLVGITELVVYSEHNIDNILLRYGCRTKDNSTFINFRLEITELY